jgi:hypothetical protein
VRPSAPIRVDLSDTAVTFPRFVLIPAQEHRYGTSSVAPKRRGPASDRYSLRGRVAAIALLAALAGIPSGASGSTANAPGMQPPIVATLPSISGTYHEAQTLTADEGTWDGPDRDYEFRWVRCNSVGSLCDPVISATGQDYLLTAADVGSTLRVVVTATNKNGSAIATSDATPGIALPLPTTSSTTTSTSSTTTPEATSSTTTATTTTTTTTTPHLFDGFSAGLTQWQINDPDPSSPHPPRTRATTVAADGYVLDLTVDPTDGYKPGSNDSSRVDVWMYSSCCTSWLGDGAEIWGHVRLLFPSSALSSTPYKPTNGAWNWTHQLHYGSLLGGSGLDVEHSWNVVTGNTITDVEGSTSSNQNPHLVLTINGGDVGAGKQQRHDFGYPHLLEWDHWYDLLYHEKLSPNGSIGFVEAWVDGNVLVPFTYMPTLYSEGSTTDVMFPELSNYRWMGQSGGVDWSSSIWYDGIAIGPSRASVGG